MRFSFVKITKSCMEFVDFFRYIFVGVKAIHFNGIDNAATQIVIAKGFCNAWIKFYITSACMLTLYMQTLRQESQR